MRRSRPLIAVLEQRCRQLRGETGAEVSLFDNGNPAAVRERGQQRMSRKRR